MVLIGAQSISHDDVTVAQRHNTVPDPAITGLADSINLWQGVESASPETTLRHKSHCSEPSLRKEIEWFQPVSDDLSDVWYMLPEQIAQEAYLPKREVCSFVFCADTSQAPTKELIGETTASGGTVCGPLPWGSHTEAPAHRATSGSEAPLRRRLL